MEPVTVTTLLAQYGVRQLVGALGGNPALGDLAAQLFGVVLASENRWSEQLAGIERRLDEVLEQRYSTAVGFGPLRIEWNRVERSPSRRPQILRSNDDRSPAPSDVLHVHGEVQADPVLALPLTLQLASPPEWPSSIPHPGRAGGSWTMEAGNGSFVFFRKSAPLSFFGGSHARLIVGRVFIFDSPPVTRPDARR
ncbi:hypothetical protein ACFVXA_08650 [Streptomyces sp. NPDC058246]|uniref:hypothetical protein n=1 Tax=Streptomyces sp. NPDC058246 TaxID=3346400 RepID=UPI0036E42C8F